MKENTNKHLETLPTVLKPILHHYAYLTFIPID